ncbi:hypothetical protein BH10PAT4_BH10PAT4_4800 [soil metagenome]
MSVLEFIAALVAALAWPLGLIVVVLVLRSHIPAFLKSLRRLKLSGFEVELERTRVDIETAVAVADTLPADRENEPSAEVALGDPTTTIIREHRRLEDELRQRLKASKVKGLESKSANQLVALGVASGIFTEAAAEAVRGVSVLRNLAAHGRADRVTPSEAAEYVALVDATIFSLRAKPQ